MHIGSLKLSAWTAVYETVTIRQAQTIFQTTPTHYLLVVKTLDPLDIVGVIFPSTLESVVAAISKDDKTTIHKPTVEVDGLVSRTFKLMPISGGLIGDLDDAFEGGTSSVILYRTTHELSLVQSNNNEEVRTVERKHVIAVVTHADVKRWIAEIEGHHNM